jgi:class 3 adenylate cyclase
VKLLEFARHPKFATHRTALFFAAAGTGLLGLGFGLLVFAALGGGCFGWWLKNRKTGQAKDQPEGHAEEPAEPSLLISTPRKVAVVALHGSMRGFNQLLEAGGADEATDALNDFFAFSASVVRAAGGHFECQMGASFGAAWEIAEGGAIDAAGRAVICALSLRLEFERLNEARKVDGKKPVRYGVGLHVGQALRARLGVVPELRESVTGEAPACARALDRIALAAGRDFVVSQALLKSAHGVFIGEALGETKLTADTGLTECYAVEDFHEEQAQPDGAGEGRFEASASRDVHLAGVIDTAKTARWLVNNGSQIVGPFTAEELARMLFAQELDFDCECWNEETGKASRLESAGIFSGGSEDAGASCWVFDGKLIHGPVTDGFVRTALSHGAFGPEAYVCENSTIAGWRKLTESPESPESKTRTPETGLGDEAA